MIRRMLLPRPIRQYLLDRMILRPSRHPMAYPTQQRELLVFEGRQLECFVQRNFPADRVPELRVLKFPGTAGRAERSSDFPMSLMHHHRVEIWTWNPPGYGRSEGRASLRSMADAAVAFWNEVVVKRPGAPSSTWLCGNSLGCVAALHVAATARTSRNSTGLILRNPPPLIPVVNRVANRYPLGKWARPVIQSLCDSMNAMHTARQVQLPAVFLQSARDSLVPPELQNRLIETYAGESRTIVLEGLEHGCPATERHLPLITDAIHWLWKNTRYDKHVSTT